MAWDETGLPWPHEVVGSNSGTSNRLADPYIVLAHGIPMMNRGLCYVAAWIFNAFLGNMRVSHALLGVARSLNELR